MNTTKVFLSYCIDNEDIAREISADISRVGIEFIHDTRNRNERSQLERQFYSNNAPIFLLVSDNFLKSKTCMGNILELINNPRLKSRIKPVVIDGRYQIAGTEAFETTPTKFDKVRDVITYINFWTDEYLSLRAKQNKMSAEEKKAFQSEVDEVQRISNTTIGEFLRAMRATKRYSYDDLKRNHFKLLFDDLGHNGKQLHRSYQALPAYEKSKVIENLLVESNGNSISELITHGIEVEEKETTEENPVENVVEHIVEQVAETVNEQDLEVVNLDEIPGMDLLSKNVDAVVEETEVVVVEDTKKVVEEIVDEVENEAEVETPSIEHKLEATIETIQEIIDEHEIDENEGVDVIEAENEQDNLTTIIEIEAEISVEEIEEEVKGEMPEHKEVPLEEIPLSVQEEQPIIIAEIGKDLEEAEESDDEDVDDEFEEDDDFEDGELDSEEKTIEQLIDEIAEDLVNQMDDDDFDDEEEEEDDDNDLEEGEYETEDATLSILADNLQINEEEEEDEIEAIEVEIEQHLEAGNYGAAQDAYVNLLQKEPNNFAYHFDYAVLLQDHLDNPRLANAHLEKAAALAPNNEDIYFRLAQIATLEEDYVQAKKYYEQIILINLDYEQAYYELGVLLVNHFENQEFVASSYFQRAIELDKDYGEAHFEFAKLLETYFKKYKKAEKHYRKAIKYDEDNATAHFALGKYYLKQWNKKKKAQKYYEKAIELDARFKTPENDDFFGIEPPQAALGIPEIVDEVVDKPTPKIVLITGATSGIGKATADLFAANGYNIIITGRREERLTEIKTLLEETHQVQVLALSFDIRNQEHTQQAIEQLSEEWRAIDVLVNNAGLAKGFAPIHKGQFWHWETMIDTNLKGLLYVTRAIAPIMVERGKGHIINIGSIAGKDVYPNGNVYSATKAAVDALTKGMRLDLYRYNIRVTGIHPGHVETEFALVRFDGDVERSQIYNDFQPLTADDVADTIYYVASRPAHVNIEDIVMWSTQQANATTIDRSGREKFNVSNTTKALVDAILQDGALIVNNRAE